MGNIEYKLLLLLGNAPGHPDNLETLQNCIPVDVFNRLTPNDPYTGRTARLTSRCCILCIYSTNIRTEYFKHAA